MFGFEGASKFEKTRMNNQREFSVTAAILTNSTSRSAFFLPILNRPTFLVFGHVDSLYFLALHFLHLWTVL